MKTRGIFIFILVLALILITMVPAMASGNNKPVIAVLLPGTVEFFSVERRGMDEAAKKYGINLIYADAQWDANKQLSQVENFIARKVDGILLCAADNMALLPAVRMANSAKIPLISFTNSLGTDPEGKYKGVVSYVGRSEIGAGIIQAKIAEKLLGDKPAKILLIEGQPGTTPQRMREQGFLKIAKNHANWKIVDKHPVEGWTKEGTLNFMESFLQSGRKINLVSCQWWSGAIAASMALKERNMKDVYVSGLEYSKEIIPYIKSGAIAATTYFSVVKEGYMAVEAAAKCLKGEKIPQFIENKQIIVTKDNVDQFKPEL